MGQGNPVSRYCHGQITPDAAWSRNMRFRLSFTAALLAAVSCASAQAPDSPWLYGIHWYNLNTASTDTEAMTGNKGVWVLENAHLDSVATVAEGNPWETPWQTTPVVDKTIPYYKPGYASDIIAKTHSMI